MSDPYDILGVAKDSDDDRIRSAYKAMAADHLGLNDRSSLDKMNKIDRAYDEIVKQRYELRAAKGGNDPVSEYCDVRRLISDERLNDAEEILDSVRSLSRGGEWNYLKAQILWKRGFSTEAALYLDRALQKDSENAEFCTLRDSMNCVGGKSRSGRLSSLLKRLRGAK